MEHDFEYYAFISYKREDERWAKWLQRKIENYRLPAIIRKEIPRLPKRIRPVFRDKTDLGAGILTDSLRKELERSQYLIVICSPQSAKSEWVGKEIEAFIEMGRTERIIPFVIEGIPNSNDQQKECFHPIIKSKIPNILGVNIDEIGKQQAFVKVVAKLLNLRFDALWNRSLREQRKNRIITLIASVLLLVGITCIWDYYRPKVEYYADYVDKWGIAEGVIKLNKSQIKKRSVHYRFEKSQRKLRRVIYANSAGVPVNHGNTEHVDRASIQNFTYKDNGRLDFIELQNAQGKTIVTQFIGGENYDRIDLKSSSMGESSATLAASFTSIDNNIFSENSITKAEIKRYKLTRNNDGYIIRKEFMRNNGDDKIPAKDANGIFGFEYNLDRLGRSVEVCYLGHNKQYFPDKVGVMSRQYEYDQYGNIHKASYFGANKQLILNEHFWAVCVEISDKNGNMIECNFYDTSNKLCFQKRGYAKLTCIRDEKGNVIESATFDTNGDPCYDLDGIARGVAKYDKKGYRIESSFFGIDGKPCFIKDGYAKFTARYDKNGNRVETAWYGIDNNLCFTRNGYAKTMAKYDDSNNLVEVEYFGIDGNLCFIKEGYAKETFKYDNDNNRIESAYFGTDGMPCFVKAGYSKITYKYDENGNLEKKAYLDTNDNICYNKDGVAKYEYVYDERGNVVEMNMLIDDMWESNNEKTAKVIYEYNEKGLCVQKWFYDKKGNLESNGCAKWNAIYDEVGNQIEVFHFDKEGKQLYNEKIEYDDRGNNIVNEYYDTNGKLCLTEKGFAKFTNKYDERGNLIEGAYFGLDEMPCLLVDGFSKSVRTFDERGNITESSFYGVDGKLCLRDGGFSKVTYKYDKIGNEIEKVYWGVDDKMCITNEGIAKATAKYDIYGNMIEGAVFGVDGEPCFHKKFRWAKWTQEFDNKGLYLSSRTFGIDNKLCIAAEGYAMITRKYDDRGNVIEEAYWDTNEDPVISIYGFAKATTIFNYLGEMSDFKKYGINDELLASSTTFLVVQDGGAAYKKGLRDTALILRYCDWEYGETHLKIVTTTTAIYKEKEKELVILNAEGQIKKYQFDKGLINALFIRDEVSGEKFYEIEKQYNEWKKSDS